MNRNPRLIWMTLGAAAALSLGGCIRHHPGLLLHAGRPLVVDARLNCPQGQGWLTLVSAAPDGNRCEYRRGDGEQVSLLRLPLGGQTPQAALEPMENQLRTLLPPPRAPAPAPAQAGAANDKDTARIDVPGVHIDARGDKAEVRVFGVTVDADNDKANVNAGFGSNRAVVSADDHGAEVRATDIDAVNANIVLVLASETPGPTGFRTVGYIARGPVGGPLLVAQFKGADRRDGLNDDHDVRRLMNLNLRR